LVVRHYKSFQRGGFCGNKFIDVDLVENFLGRLTQGGLLGELLHLFAALSRASRETRAEQTLHELVRELDSVERVFLFCLLLEDHDPVVDLKQDVFHLRILALAGPLLQEKMALDVKRVVADAYEEAAHHADLDDDVGYRYGVDVTFRLVFTQLVLHQDLSDEKDGARNSVREPLCAQQGGDS